MVQRRFANQRVPHETVGVGVDVPADSGTVERGDIRDLGRVSDEVKWDALAAATALVMPSRLESLSLATLEARAMGRPTICSARSPVLASMSRRAGAGLAYRTAAEFAEICELLAERPEFGDRIGASGRAFVERTYTWPAVVEKYRDLLSEVRARNGGAT